VVIVVPRSRTRIGSSSHDDHHDDHEPGVE
jgi:hypothetical protein